MARVHIVKDGECMSTIAHRYEFRDWRTIYDDPQNALLRSTRPNPNLLRRGDEVVIPDPVERVETKPTGSTHRFVVSAAPCFVHIVVLDEDDDPVGGQPYLLEVDGEELQGDTAADGRIHRPIARDARNGQLTVGSRHWRIQFGGLDPVARTRDNGVAGFQGRLTNLGYNAGAVDGVAGPRTRAAVTAFQKRRSLKQDGELDPETRAALVRAHGC